MTTPAFSALPERPLVLKLGGKSLEAPGATRQLALELSRVSGGRVVVHGGGAEASAWCARLGIEQRFHDGLRVTDAATLDVVTAVLGGLANKRLVAELRAAGVDAVGLSALDGGILEVAPHADSAVLGAVGQVHGAEPALLELLLAQGRVPVLASIGACDGALLNLNADDVAGAVAGALRARALVLLSDVAGLMLDGALVSHMTLAELRAALDHQDVTGGMRPKLRAAETALELGCPRVTITSWAGKGTLAALIAGQQAGTTITHEHSNAALAAQEVGRG
jgi:acetylglutamate kinase